MTYIPAEPPYTDDFLREEHKEFFAGWDAAVETMQNAFDSDDRGTGIDGIDKIIKGIESATKEDILHDLELSRQMCIVSFIDGYSDEELKERGYIED